MQTSTSNHLTRFPLAFRSIFLAGLLLAVGAVAHAQELQPIPRLLPPPGIELPAPRRQEIERHLDELTRSIEALADRKPDPVSSRIPDVEIFSKAIHLALLHGEFYDAKDVDKAQRLLDIGKTRAAQLQRGESPWTRQVGLVVRGFRSAIDGSAQPYGLVIPEKIDLSGERTVPLYVWLHGRSDQMTDMHFIDQRLRQAGQVTPPDAIVLHPFGRYCNAFKFAGETDVLESIQAVCRDYTIDPRRIVLWGFSMGGAGAWHLGAHYADRFVAVCPGAGFADTRRYQNLAADNLPPPYEQALWGLYDAPPYVRNLFNVPVIAYSGELDKQIQAARLMEEAYAEHGQKLTHLIGPGTEHKYHPETLQELKARIGRFVQEGRTESPSKVTLQTRTLRYDRSFWVRATRLEKHWHDARIDAEAIEDRQIVISTQNVRGISLTPPWPKSPGGAAVDMFTAATVLRIDGQRLPAPKGETLELFKAHDGRWQIAAESASPTETFKSHGLQGPIDDVWYDPFLVVLPTGNCVHPNVDRFVQFELDHFRRRWRELFRGEARVKTADEVTDDDIARYHLVVWGDPTSNAILARASAKNDSLAPLPVYWNDAHLCLGHQPFDAATHVPAVIYPNPLNPSRYLVINSGLTFREAHDRTNSQQTPKLPDFAIIDVSVPPTAQSPGKIVEAGFFDDDWQLPD